MLWYEGAAVSGTTRRQLFAGHQGSIVAIANGTGTLTDHDSYDEWGIPGSTNNASERFGYTGQAWLPEVGLWYYKARIYSPTLGRFMQTDPVGYDDQINLYAYVGNDPVNGADPTGEATIYIYNNNQIVILQTFDNHTQFTNDQISQQEQNYSGTTSQGQSVTTTFTPGTDGDTVHLMADRSLNDTSPIGSQRSHIDSIGGNTVHVAPNAVGPVTVGHEIGHKMGAGDQYVGGVDAQGLTVTTPPPNSANSIMRDLNRPANHQSLDEIVNAPTNTVRDCTVTAFDTQCE